MAASLEVSVWRGAAEGRFESYAVPECANQTVLDVVTYIQRRIEPSLAYRFACRVGMCGSCAMTVNGRARWTCRTHVAAVAKGGRLRIAPLRNMTVIKDLAVDMEGFFAKQSRAGGAFRPGPKVGSGFAAVRPDSAKRRLADAAIECIGCGVCYASCDVVAWNPDYLGPAALNRAWSLHNDERDRGGPERLRAVAGDAGCHSCHSHESCRERCPKHLNPTASIAGLKRATALAALGREW
jgi:fumarate reductase iron-sulfur subunit